MKSGQGDGQARTVARDKDEPAESRSAGPRASPQDLALVQQLLAGEEPAFTSLVERYQGQLLRLALVFVADRETAEEVVQDTWLGVLNGLPRFEGRSTLKGWIFRILTNRAKTRGIREGRSSPFSALADPDTEDEPAVDPERFAASGMWAKPPGPWGVDTPEGLFLRGETLALLKRAIADLPASQRAVVTLRDVEGLDAEEVCNILDISETNQRVLLHRARSRIRRALERHLGGE
jgi:RNA polymerase sigma-70 factor (ECF subfamily)